jgi:hypothetical protein
MNMQRFTAALVLWSFSLAAAPQQASNIDHSDKPWIQQSNVYTDMLLNVELEHTPERGSRQGLAQFDSRISNPTLIDQLAERRELEAALLNLKAARKGIKTSWKIWKFSARPSI